MDYYKVLGVSRNASKKEIKEAFMKQAMQFHPDKHSHSSNSIRDAATLHFKHATEAYQTLIDDRKRANYNLRSNNNNYSKNYNNNNNGPRTTSGFNSSAYGHNPRSGTNYNYGYYRRAANGYGFVCRFEIALRSLTTRSFLLSLAFAGVLFGGTVVINTSRDALWKMHNPGKSFEDAMESVKKAKAVKDEM